MRRLSLTALLLAAPVLAQEAAEPPAAPPPAEAPAPAQQAPESEAPAADAPAQDAAQAPAEAAPPPRKRRQKASPKPAAKAAPKPAAKAVKPAPPAPAQAEKAPAPETPAPEAEPRAAEPAAAPPPAEPAVAGQVSARERVAEEARVFFSLLLSGDVRTLSFRLDFPFQLESRRFDGSDELVSEWARSLRQRRTDLVTLYDIEVLSPEEMERKYGAPPKRLGTLDYRGPNTFLAVANLSGHAAVAVFRVSQGAVKAVAYTD